MLRGAYMRTTHVLVFYLVLGVLGFQGLTRILSAGKNSDPGKEADPQDPQTRPRFPPCSSVGLKNGCVV